MNKLILISICFLLLNSANSQQCLDTTAHSGIATYYSGNGPGICGLFVKPDSMYSIGLPPALYDSSRPCGSCLLVDGPLGSVIATVQDICPTCPANNIDLTNIPKGLYYWRATNNQSTTTNKLIVK